MSENEVYCEQRWICPHCKDEHRTKHLAERCRVDCNKARAATEMLESGYSLGKINEALDLWSDLPCPEVTKENCFVLSHLQCCQKPAYRIIGVTKKHQLQLWGVGGWTGGYGTKAMPHMLPKPHPPGDLFIDTRAAHLRGRP